MKTTKRSWLIRIACVLVLALVAVVMLRMSLDEICGKANKGKLSD